MSAPAQRIAVVRKLVRTVRSKLDTAENRMWSSYVMTAIRENAGETDEKKMATMWAEADNYAEYLNAREKYIGLLKYYGIHSEIDEKTRLQTNANRVGLQLPEVFGPEVLAQKESEK
uniref:Uncharacterized protein n=1 Tax=Palpitomonas bilix TaxID=652834 RepID=A0A7S3G2K0_9EUKA|mmetsp:Transcript_23686/g.59691  ORF Transcript_23686/g.59691 Transcript_23686/m.59691 type:complete len:117 (+) Transcript_23686:358-708(+)|eukprot:CAMPEP_0113885300 /NCGR_PEP_ID=MMETSP0780_2-20120614/10824_1 /TAXON_ID=652834 /ORGANISM="Palpitomonas bilix" /LENGTH=116 /DNA_ID=CAMNT_0000873191 /DNA_START=118 /DNA_END=468 /DNA_ORIENTATION=+ /assembly_acc=CAM_ASM_000599